MTLSEFWLPYTISQIVFLLLLFVSWRWFTVGRVLWILIFFAAGLFNFYTASTQPEVYVMYADGALLPFYKQFILGDFANHAALYVKLIAIGQVLVSFLMMLNGRLFKLGCLGCIIFLLAISPLGIGSALPATIIGAAALFFLWKHGAAFSIFHITRVRA